MQLSIQFVFLVSLIFLKFKLSVLKTIIFPTSSLFLFKMDFTTSLACSVPAIPATVGNIPSESHLLSVTGI